MNVKYARDLIGLGRAHRLLIASLPLGTGWTPLHWAAAIGDVESVAALIDARKPTLNVQNKKGETPLHLAARENHANVTQ